MTTTEGREGETGRPYERHAFVCTYGPWCAKEGPALAAQKIMKRLVKEAGPAGSGCRVNQSGCLSQCGHGPMMVVYPEGVWYSGVDEAKAARIAREHLVGGRVVEELRYVPEHAGANKTPRVKAAEAAEKAAEAAAKGRDVG